MKYHDHSHGINRFLKSSVTCLHNQWNENRK